MAYDLSTYLRLRIDANLTANAKANLRKIDDLASRFYITTAGDTAIRSLENISLVPNDASLGGSGIGGTITLGENRATYANWATLAAYVSAFSIGGSLSLLDQAGTPTDAANKYLAIRYKSDLSGTIDQSANRTLSIDLQGANRSMILGGALTTAGDLTTAGAFALTFTTTAATSVTLPTTGTLATLAGAETLTNKTIVAGNNTISGLVNANIDAAAAIAYSKLALSSSIATGDLAAALLVPISKGGTGATTATDAITALLPSQAAAAGKVLTSNGTVASWSAIGMGTVTSVGLSAPAIFSVADSPVTVSGTIALSLATQVANRIWAGPSAGADAAPTFRALVAADVPALSALSGSLALGSQVSGALPIANGGTGQVTAQAAIDALLPSQGGNSGKVLGTNGTTASWVAALTTTLASANIFVGNGSSVATAVAMSGDVTIDNAGATTIGATKVTNAMLAGSIAYSKLVLTTSIVNGDISGSAAIAYSKLNLAGSVATADLAAALLVPATKGGTGVANNVASTLTISGAFATTLTVSAITALTLPTSGTLATLDGIETFTNKTLTSPKINENVALTTTATKLNYLTSATGTTGTTSTNVVFSTSPTLVTPILGVAAATSISFGGSALSTFVQGTWTPTLTAALNCSAATASQAYYMRVGNMVFYQLKVALSITAAGNAETNLVFTLPIGTTNNTDMVAGTAYCQKASVRDKGIVEDNSAGDSNSACCYWNANTTTGSGAVLYVWGSYAIQ